MYAAPAMTAHRFPKSMRLLQAHEFEWVFETRVSAGDDLIVVHAASNKVGHPRLGLTVSRKLGPATVRNRWKRLLREAFRLAQNELPDLDLVCIPRRGAKPELARLLKSLPVLAARVDRQLARFQERTPKEPS